MRSSNAWKRRPGWRLAALQSRRCNWRTLSGNSRSPGWLDPVWPVMPSRVLARPTLPPQGPFSARVIRRGPPHYFGPLGFPLRRARFRRGLIRVAPPRHGLRRRASRVPFDSVHTCCALYPAETDGVFTSGLEHHRCGLRREVTGSALGLWICRGCRLHLMLRPACWLPPKRLSTPRLGRTTLIARLGSATRRSGTYRGGICTR